MPRKLRTSCSVSCMRWNMLRKLRRITGCLDWGRKKPARSSSAFEIIEKGQGHFAGRGRGALDHGKGRLGIRHGAHPLVSDQKDRLRQIERGIGGIDRKGDDRIGQGHFIIGKPGALGAKQHALSFRP